MADPYGHMTRGMESPAEYHYTIVPADGVDLDPRPRGIRIQTSGNLAVRDKNDVIIVYAVIAGENLPFSAVGVEATGTDAVGIGWY